MYFLNLLFRGPPPDATFLPRLILNNTLHIPKRYIVQNKISNEYTKNRSLYIQIDNISSIMYRIDKVTYGTCNNLFSNYVDGLQDIETQDNS